MPPGTLVDVEVDGDVRVIGNVEGTFYAVSGWCSHLGSALVLGRLQGHSLTCFAHLWTYDIRTGEPTWPAIGRVVPGYRLRTYAVRVVEGSIFMARIPGRGGLN